MSESARAARYLAAIDARADLNAFIHVDRDARGAGLVVAAKDNIDVAGMPTSAGGRHLSPRPRTRDAASVRALRAAGCAIIGKTGLYEYALGATARNEHHGDVLHPSDPRLEAGGSSGGSAVAVAAGMCDAALGTDTLGSVRLPAALCGVVGYKPARARIPRRGVFPNSMSLDAVGVIARDVRTAAEVAELASSRWPTGEMATRTLRLAVPWSWLHDVDPEVGEAFHGVAGGLREIEMPPREVIDDVAFKIAGFESHALHAGRLRERPELFGYEVRELLERSASIKRSTYLAARRDLLKLRRTMRRQVASVDAVLLPTVPCWAPSMRSSRSFEVRRRLSSLTRPFNVSDSPAISIPIAGARAPVGLQIVARSEALAVAVALMMESGPKTGRST